MKKANLNSLSTHALTYWRQVFKRKGMRGLAPGKAEGANILHQLLYGTMGSFCKKGGGLFLLDEYNKVLERKKMYEGHVVYLIGNKSLKWVKIGHSGSVLKRVSQIQVGCPFEVDILGVIPTTKESAKKKEGKVHAQFKHLHLHGEWYKFTDEIECFISKENSVG